MKLRQHSVPLSILLLQLLSLVNVSSLDTATDLSVQLARRDADIPTHPSLDPTKIPPEAHIGKKDGPLDGKDGLPHEGPFVETSAQRERKKALESGDDDAPTAAKRPGPSDGSSTKDGWNKDMPVSNDGVMDDPNRVGPKEGTRGIEGGITEKTRGKFGLDSAKKMPEEPKEAPPLPHSEQEKLSVADDRELRTDKEGKDPKDADKDDISELGGLTKPDDLPEKPHDIPHPVPVSSSKEDPLKVKTPPSTGSTSVVDSSTLIQPLHSFLLSFTMILFSEIGDKTFLVAALMAMKHPPLLVFSAAFAALTVMTVLSAVLGHAVPTLLPAKLTNFMAAILFLVFGLKMLREGLAMSPEEGVGEEMKEVEMEMEEKEAMARKMGRRRSSSITPYMLEAGRTRKARSNSRLPAPPDSPPSSPDNSRSPSPSRSSGLSGALAGLNNLFSLLFSPAWVQTFIMTFLGEWGDRSQIATIAMAAGQDYWWVTSGALAGHSICTAAAVIGGRAIAGRVSLRVVTLGGAIAFLIFGVIYLAEALYYR